MITGRGRYVDDMVVPGMLYMAVVRSPEAHAKIVSIDASGARELPGVHGVFTGEDLDIAVRPADGVGAAGRRDQDARALAARQGRGQATSARASRSSSATTSTRVVDAAEQVLVEYEPLPVVVDPEKAIKEARRSSTTTSAPTRSTSGRSAAATWTRRGPRPTS